MKTGSSDDDIEATGEKSPLNHMEKIYDQLIAGFNNVRL